MRIKTLYKETERKLERKGKQKRIWRKQKKTEAKETTARGGKRRNEEGILGGSTLQRSQVSFKGHGEPAGRTKDFRRGFMSRLLRRGGLMFRGRRGGLRFGRSKRLSAKALL